MRRGLAGHDNVRTRLALLANGIDHSNPACIIYSCGYRLCLSCIETGSVWVFAVFALCCQPSTSSLSAAYSHSSYMTSCRALGRSVVHLTSRRWASSNAKAAAVDPVVETVEQKCWLPLSLKLWMHANNRFSNSWCSFGQLPTRWCTYGISEILQDSACARKQTKL